jgi:methanol metabolism-related c-type cytochrome
LYTHSAQIGAIAPNVQKVPNSGIKTKETERKRVNRFSIQLAAAAIACSVLGYGVCLGEEGPAGDDNASVQAAAKDAGAVFKDGRYRDKDGRPQPVATKDYKVDWETWQGFRRYHDACHVCHGPNALGSTFAPALAESLKTMDYETFYGTVVGGRIVDRAGTKYVMPSFGEDKNIMCYLDDIYSYIKARSNYSASEGKQGMPPGRPNGREDISPEAKKAAADCTG